MTEDNSDVSESIDRSLRNIINLSEIIHSPVRLAIMMYLMLQGNSTFPDLKKTLQLTPGNLSSHIGRLEKENFIYVEKKFVNSKPTTLVSISPLGIRAISEYSSVLSGVLNKIDPS